MRKLVTPASHVVPSRTSPVSRSRLGISIAASGSVHSITSTPPAEIPDSSLRVLSGGNGHFRPRRLTIVSPDSSVIADSLRGDRDILSCRPAHRGDTRHPGGGGS